jgi:hypothetical protein
MIFMDAGLLFLMYCRNSIYLDSFELDADVSGLPLEVDPITYAAAVDLIELSLSEYCIVCHEATEPGVSTATISSICDALAAGGPHEYR